MPLPIPAIPFCCLGVPNGGGAILKLEYGDAGGGAIENADVGVLKDGLGVGREGCDCAHRLEDEGASAGVLLLLPQAEALLAADQSTEPLDCGAGVVYDGVVGTIGRDGWRGCGGAG